MNIVPHPYIQLARQSIRHYLTNDEIPTCPSTLSSELKKPSGVFVCIKKDGRLRGCVGSLNPQESNLATEIIQNTIKAARDDPRFSPVTLDELPSLTFAIDVIAPMEEVRSLKDLDTDRYGLVIQSGEKRGVLLPMLEGISTVEEQIRICRNKANIEDSGPQEMYRFEVQRYS